MNEQASRKLFRTLLLFLAGTLVITASATVYNIMQMQASPVKAEPAKVQFVIADDSAVAGTSIGTNGTYVLFSGMSGWPNATRVYEAAVGIKNFDTRSRIIELMFDSWSGSTENVDYIHVKIFDEGGTQQGYTVNVGTEGSSTGTVNIPAGATWRVQWEIKWKAEALSTDSVSVTLKLVINE